VTLRRSFLGLLLGIWQVHESLGLFTIL
jgi:hypothetical protein